MQTAQISNRPGPDCELTVRIKFPDLDRFRADYREQIAKGGFFIKSSRSKPVGTRLQIIFVIEDMNNLEVWSWGIIQQIVSPAEAAQAGTNAGIHLQLMDITPKRRNEIERLFSTDEAVEAIKQRHLTSDSSAGQAAGYAQVTRDPRHELMERAQELVQLVASGADLYQLLGVPRTASRDDIREAYRERTRRYHPDRFVRRIPEHAHEELDKAFQKVIEAQRTLSDEDERAAYDTSIGNYSNPKAQRAAMPHVRLQRQFRKVYSSIVESRSPQVQALLEEAHREYLADSYKLAYSKLKLAQALDPLNPQIKAKLKEIKVYVDKEAAEQEAEENEKKKEDKEKRKAEKKKKEAERGGH